MEKLKEEIIMYRIPNSNGIKPEVGDFFEFKPTFFQKLFGFKAFGNFMLLEDNAYGNDSIKVKVHKGSLYLRTTWGALVSRCEVVA